MYRLLIKWSIIGAFVIFIFPNLAKSQAALTWNDPIRRCWSSEGTSTSSRKNASDNETTIFSPHLNAAIHALDAKSGEEIWLREFNGQLASEIKVDKKSLYFAVISTVENETGEAGKSNDNPQHDEEFQNIEINSVDIDSGLNNWVLGLKHNKLGDEFSILLDSDFLYIISNRGEVSAIRKTDKTLVWYKTFDTSLSATPIILGDRIFIGTTNKTVIGLSSRNGNIVDQIPLGFVPTSLTTSGEILFAGDKTGNISAISHSNNSKLWNSLTGGEIVEITLIGSDILVASNDNFIYRFSGQHGTKMWKRRLSGRILGSTGFGQETMVFLSVGSSEALLVNLESGKIINRISVNPIDYFVSSPLSIGERLILPTNTGLESYSPSCQPGSTS